MTNLPLLPSSTLLTYIRPFSALIPAPNIHKMCSICVLNIFIHPSPFCLQSTNPFFTFNVHQKQQHKVTHQQFILFVSLFRSLC
uniref:Uncharacterized protein n=2 Tax=Meloidogyne enterolobii TaxID=390850 RepID=A0A6V7V438_MELEN|nr:unnamed protein product [Meloidogyne enterolobii]